MIFCDSLPLGEDSRSAFSFWAEATLAEYVKARWQPASNSAWAQAEPMLRIGRAFSMGLKGLGEGELLMQGGCGSSARGSGYQRETTSYVVVGKHSARMYLISRSNRAEGLFEADGWRTHCVREEEMGGCGGGVSLRLAHSSKRSCFLRGTIHRSCPANIQRTAYTTLSIIVSA